MIVRGRKRAVRKTAPSTAARRKAVKLKPSPEISPQDVASFEIEAARHQRSESAWQSLANPAPGEDDRWTAVEEHLLARSQGKDHSMRRWKYFAK